VDAFTVIQSLKSAATANQVLNFYRQMATVVRLIECAKVSHKDFLHFCIHPLTKVKENPDEMESYRLLNDKQNIVVTLL